MHLLVVRHGIAEDHEPDADDTLRELTREGERKTRRKVRALHDRGFRLDRIHTSPWLRAARTAELLAAIASTAPLETELLAQAPGADLLALIAAPGGPSKKRHAIAVVGHQPWLSQLIAWLALGSTTHADAFILKKAATAWLIGDPVPGRMQLRALF